MNTQQTQSKTKKKNYTKGNFKPKPSSFYIRVLSRHPSTSKLRESILVKGIKACYRHGSTTVGNFDYEINSVESVETSADKKLMKEAFDRAEVKHPTWISLSTWDKDKKTWDDFLSKLKFGKEKDSWLIIKQRWGSRGEGNTLIRTTEELTKFIKEKTKHLANYIVEEYKHYTVEYRLHVTENGCFYACRKMIKTDTPKEKRFQRHDDNCVWVIETNPQFNKPANWDDIVKDCVHALKSIKADVLAFDVKCTSIKDSKDKKCNYVLLESCSAPSYGEITLEKYKEELPKILYRKYESHK